MIDKNWYTESLCCPDCRNDILRTTVSITCSKCDYTAAVSDPIELKPNNPRGLIATLSRTLSTGPSVALKGIEISPPEMSYTGPQAIRDSRWLMSEMARYLGKQGTVLDLGCGPRDQADPVDYLGYQYVGIDYSNERADLLADAHAIPFKDNTFDCVLSYAVLEHLHNPFIAITEIERVLKPGGVYIGSVSQGEPFHSSYFHHTSWGLISLISSVSSLKINRIWSSGDTLKSLFRMGRYPRVIRSLLALIHKMHTALPFLAPRRMRWPQREKQLDTLFRAGSLCFVVQKPPTQ